MTGTVGRYRLYGVSLESSLRLPAPRAPGGGRPDVVLRASPAAAFPRVAPNGRWYQHSRNRRGASHLRWADLFEFLVSPDGRTIRYRMIDRSSPESVSAYLVGQAMSFALLARGTDPLHGTAVDVDGEAVVFLGECGAGKSTLAAGLLGRGHRLATDDLAVLEPRGDGFVLHPGPGRVKLFPRMAGRLVPDRRGTAMIRGTRKLILPLAAGETASGPLPVRAFYVLERTRSRRIRVETLAPAQACIQLIRAAFNLSITDRSRLQGQFRFVSRLARAVPVFRLTYPRLLDALPAVCEAVVGATTARARLSRRAPVG